MRTVLAIAAELTAVAAVFGSGNLSPGVREDRGDRWAIVAFGALAPVTRWSRTLHPIQ